MLIVFIRAIMIYFFLLVVMRLMGKKQLGELQPFEFAITLIAADLACIPISDTSVPVLYGLVPIFTLFVIHLVLTKVMKHSIKVRRVINGKPIVVIDSNGINYKTISELDMTINDLLESLRGAGYFSPADVHYAIVETNGDLTVLPKAKLTPLTPGDIGLQVEQKSVPYMLICEGKMMSQNMQLAGVSTETVTKILEKHCLKQKKVLLLTVTDGDQLFLQPISDKAIQTSITEVNNG